MVIESKDNSIEVICQHRFDGAIIPLRIRLKDEDGEFQTYTVRSYRELHVADRSRLPSDIVVSSRIYSYECKIMVFARERIVRIFYNLNDGIWRIRYE